LRVEERRVEVYFGTIEESRVYAIGNSPLTRVLFDIGDTITDTEERELEVLGVEEIDGITAYYVGDREQPELLLETALADSIQMSDARARLFSGQVDEGKWFDLRRDCIDQIHRAQTNPAFGLIGARVTPVPHQLYIASEVASRQLPRVLLADEVGLGKTIEACLILHRQMLTGQTRRVLIIVPEPLTNQWLVELRRRFNLSFSLFDEERYDAVLLEDADINPFESEQLILTSLSNLMLRDDISSSVVSADWDMLIVDEAHHIYWQEDAENTEYQFVDSLASNIASVLLLTATPESLGSAGHFARLRLLDENRFSTLGDWLKEQQGYKRTSELANSLLDTEHDVPEEIAREVNKILGRAEDSAVSDPDQRRQLLGQLLDRHGTSRVMFRNTRATIAGFPQRLETLYPLQADAVDESLLASLPLQELPLPELTAPNCWPQDDARINWLIDLLQKLAPAKVLVICARAETAIDLENQLRILTGIRAGLFHEELSIVARDRAAAWFAEPTETARALICSEIGSEGRNFQFASHLVLFDLPLNPDLLEQRIGRLDRIGQLGDVNIHVPQIADQPINVLGSLYSQSLDAFRTSSPLGGAVFESIDTELQSTLRNPADSAQLEALLKTSTEVAATHRTLVENGRDRLLELASFDAEKSNAIVKAISDSDASEDFSDFSERLLDALGVDIEDDDNGIILHPSPRMRVAQFPGIPDDGIKCTFDRGFALTHEDQGFLTPEHPIIRDSIDMVLSGQQGRAAIVTLPIDVLPTGTLLIETLHVLEIRAPGFLAFQKLFPNLATHQLLGPNGRDLTKLTSTHVWPDRFKDVERRLIRTILSNFREKIRGQIDLAGENARKVLDAKRTQGIERFRQQLIAERDRLIELRKTNPNVREGEIVSLELFAGELAQKIQSAAIRLDAVRVHVVP